jgi:hypothetical protein
VVQFACHPEQALFAKRRIWASRAQNRARLARFLFKLHHYPTPQEPHNSQSPPAVKYPLLILKLNFIFNKRGWYST